LQFTRIKSRRIGIDRNPSQLNSLLHSDT
jgi:hypothetical protein